MLKALIIDMSDIIYRFQQVGEAGQTRAEAIFRDFIQTVEKNYRTERRVSWYAQQLCITSKYLSEPCVLSADVHQVIGLTPTLHVSYA